jgi:hypothetical protein
MRAVLLLLRQLQIHMAMIRDYPRYYMYDARLLITRLVELSLAPLSASGLSAAELDAVFRAASQTDQSGTERAKANVASLGSVRL